MLILLDSTVLIDYLRDLPAATRVDAFSGTRDRPYTTAVNVEEVVRGLFPRERQKAERLFSGLRVLPLGAEEGWLAGEWRRHYGSRGITLLQADCLIAASAAVHRAVLATGNPKHFPMGEVRVEHWPVGE